MDEYLCLTLRSEPGEDETQFGKRLSLFWSGMLRDRKDDFEKVYAETTKFDRDGGALTRDYLIEADVAELLAKELAEAGLAFDEIDPDDVYSKYEATPPEWMWIEH